MFMGNAFGWYRSPPLLFLLCVCVERHFVSWQMHRSWKSNPVMKMQWFPQKGNRGGKSQLTGKTVSIRNRYIFFFISAEFTDKDLSKLAIKATFYIMATESGCTINKHDGWSCLQSSKRRWNHKKIELVEWKTINCEKYWKIWLHEIWNQKIHNLKIDPQSWRGMRHDRNRSLVLLPKYYFIVYLVNFCLLL